jgi:hypothetical protein
MKTARSLYSRLENDRWSFLSRARECAKVTLPFLIPPLGHGPVNALPTPYQGIGARGVNNLASKLILGLLPPNAPFFRLVIDDSSLSQAGMEQLKTEIDLALAAAERSLMSELDQSTLRQVAFETFRHLIVSGNGLLYLPEDGLEFRHFSLENYVVDRDPRGNILGIVTRESVSPEILPEETRESLAKDGVASADKTVDLYTACIREDGGFRSWQEVAGDVLPDSEQTHKDSIPYICLRWNHISGEAYGRGLVEEYLGDLLSLEGLSRAIVEGSAASAKMLFLVNPNGITRSRTLAESPNGAIRDGNANDVTVLQANKFADFRVAFETIGAITERLGQAFLLNTAVQRNGERVTATEIRAMLEELESSLGGTYSTLASEFQLPLVKQVMQRMAKQGRFPKLPKDTVRPQIVTGVQALGRGQDLMRLDTFVQGLVQTLGPDAMRRLNVAEYLNRRALALGVEPRNLIRSEEEIQAEMQQAQQMQMVNQLGPSAIQGMAKVATSPMASQQQGETVVG